MKRAVFTKDNREKTRSGLKTQTRRLGENPWRVSVGQVMCLAEPIQVLEFPECRNTAISVKVKYLDTDSVSIVEISQGACEKLQMRKDCLKPAIARFMLDDFKRHYIKILDIREEYLQDISEADAIAEGVEEKRSRAGVLSAKAAFMRLWDSIHTLPARQSKENPRVTAYTYQFFPEKPLVSAEV